jgi:hypothetical protein
MAVAPNAAAVAHTYIGRKCGAASMFFLGMTAIGEICQRRYYGTTWTEEQDKEEDYD